jgi:hypothetical protein
LSAGKANGTRETKGGDRGNQHSKPKSQNATLAKLENLGVNKKQSSRWRPNGPPADHFQRRRRCWRAGEGKPGWGSGRFLFRGARMYSGKVGFLPTLVEAHTNQPMANTYYWLDPARRVTGVILTQILPGTDPLAGRTYGQFPAGVYKALASG